VPFENYFQAQDLFGMPRKARSTTASIVDLDLSTVVPGVAGPKRPQDRIDLPSSSRLQDAPHQARRRGGYGKDGGPLDQGLVARRNRPSPRTRR